VGGGAHFGASKPYSRRLKARLTFARNLYEAEFFDLVWIGERGFDAFVDIAVPGGVVVGVRYLPRTDRLTQRCGRTLQSAVRRSTSPHP
jgi:hypothetical protein